MARQRPTRIPTPHVMGPCIVEIDEVQYQLEVNRLKGNFVWVWPMWAGHPRIDLIVIRIVQYQLEVNGLKGNVRWVWPMWAGRPRIDRIVITYKSDDRIRSTVQYQFDVNRCRNEEVNFQGSSVINGQTDGRQR
ncbi:hypothetical protein DPMN_074909 [Dreissena polymorpha]|uniref:Uncharacterized protein n=1 Tax=Dreissena polymorpha TaxID=45954 RepID=A0A9D4BM04_DREPO|nr:hypothetical protein DPMN_074909 [Dreissena polymorpha]